MIWLNFKKIIIQFVEGHQPHPNTNFKHIDIPILIISRYYYKYCIKDDFYNKYYKIKIVYLLSVLLGKRLSKLLSEK